MQTPNEKASKISSIFQRTIDLENFAFKWLEDEPEVFNKIKRNTNSIKSIITKYLDTGNLPVEGQEVLPL